MTECETIHDCDLPTDKPHTLSEGDTVICPKCGREWEYSNRWFSQTGRKVASEVSDNGN